MERRQDKLLDFTLVIAPNEADDDYRDVQTRQLRDLIEDQIDEAEARLVTDDNLPANVRSGVMQVIGEIALKVLPSAVTGLFNLLRDWQKGKAERSITIKVGDIEVSLRGEATLEEVEESIKRLLALQNQRQP